MNKKLIVLIIILLFPSLLWAADGDITEVRINAAGWYAEVDIAGLAVGGVYNLGIGTNNDPSTAKMVFTVTSQGYADDGSLETLTRNVIGTNYKRKAYPNEAAADEGVADGTLTILVALDDWIYTDDTLTVSIASGVYSEAAGDGGTANAETTATYAVTNNSGEAYSAAKVVGNWSWPGWSRVTGSTLTLRAVAYHRSAQQKRPVRSVIFTCTDEHAHATSSTVTNMSIDNSLGDSLSVQEYIGSISTETFTDGDLLTCNFIAYPWYGDEGAILNTGDAVNAMPTPLYAPQYHLVDTSNTYGVTIACVDSALANDTAGVAADSAAWTVATGCYKNIYAAANAIAAYNNTNHSRNNTGAGIIYLKEGNHIFTGNTVSAGGQAESETWATMTRFPGTTKANVVITSAVATKQINELLKVEGITITSSTTGTFTNMKYLWLHDCTINSPNDATNYVNTVSYITASSIGDCDVFKTFSTVAASRALIRGNTSIANQTDSLLGYTVLGNNLEFTGGAGISGDYASMTIPAFNNTIYAYNYLRHDTATVATLHIKEIYTEEHGIAIIGNIFERHAGAGTGALIKLAGDASTTASNPVNNVLIWNNTFVGQRNNMAYNDYILNDVTPPVYRKHWSIRNNIFDDYNCITDLDAHGDDPDNDRIGNHSIIHGAGSAGNIILNRIGAAGYENKFGGVYYKVGSPLSPYFVNDQSLSVTGTGNGNYRINSNSPAHNLSIGTAVLPFDLEGWRRRIEADDAGCYTRGLGKIF